MRAALLSRAYRAAGSRLRSSRRAQPSAPNRPAQRAITQRFWVKISQVKNPVGPLRSDHHSLQLHRRQVWTQILLPMLLVALIILALVALISLSAFRDQGDVGRWAAIATIWLTIPTLVAGLIFLAALAAVTYAVAKVTQVIPPYSYKAQTIFQRIADGTTRAAEMVRKPALAVRGVGALLRAGWHRARERM